MIKFLTNIIINFIDSSVPEEIKEWKKKYKKCIACGARCEFDYHTDTHRTYELRCSNCHYKAIIGCSPNQYAVLYITLNNKFYHFINDFQLFETPTQILIKSNISSDDTIKKFITLPRFDFLNCSLEQLQCKIRTAELLQ